MARAGKARVTADETRFLARLRDSHNRVNEFAHVVGFGDERRPDKRGEPLATRRAFEFPQPRVSHRGAFGGAWRTP